MNVCTWGVSSSFTPYFHDTLSKFTPKVVLRILNAIVSVVVADSCLLLGCLSPTILKDCAAPTGCVFRLSFGLKMVEVC